jgi:hypothetical protein
VSTIDPKDSRFTLGAGAAGGGGGPAHPETIEQELARLRRERAEREAPDKDARIRREIEKEKLIVRFERELNGKLGSEFVIVDTGHLSDPFIVMKKPILVQWEKYTQSKMSPAERFDYIAPSIAYPKLDEYTLLRTNRAGLDTAVSNALMPMMGLSAEVEAGK